MVWTYEPDGDGEGTVWWNIVDGRQRFAATTREEHAKQICDEHNAHTALLAACKAAYAECEQDE